MNIVRLNKQCRFDELTRGDVFMMYSDYYMKIEECEFDAAKINYVCLFDGSVGYATDPFVVEKVDCELVIK